MAEGTFVEGLSGTEIVNDILSQIERKLLMDCNLRPTDSYGRGYAGKIEIHLTLHALDTTNIDVWADLRPTSELPAVSGPEIPEESTVVVLDEGITIKLEEDLNLVRERSEQPIPMQTVNEDGAAVVKRRSYTKRIATGAAL